MPTASVPTPAPRRDLRRLGRSGLAVTTVGLGCNNLGRSNAVTSTFEGSREVVHAALDAGVTFFDTADNYGARPGLSEEFLGRALGSRRDEVVIATKFGMPVRGLNGPDYRARGSRRYVMKAVEGSLQRMGTDHIDLYQFHTPDDETPIDETLAALDDLVRQGKVRYVGHSNRSGWQIADAEHVARAAGTTRFVSSQSHYNLVDRRAELEVLPAAAAYGLGVLPYFPLANGLLTGKYTGDVRPQDSRLVRNKPELLETAPWEALARLHTFCLERGVTELQVAFGWLLSHPQVTSVIAGATRPEQIAQNADAATWVPSSDDLAALDEIFPPAPKVALF
ncbi:aryl-alcohol dehydrogenase-like predicted oxidoreductase [Sediminihabitans luteus]|uniref:Aryl-alcohol dehydrogenase-like predicted oxidoreductase n=1 Tax=Sediminihabitans luteus TaxID=1138585 RepID=A0A2M9CPF7_9CELL|nr:aldo/keto reductase [Sediminihabitans luteus]PJJ73782.1 aryl-alcohol dehydrogenase-like predicted oxidoreductase [Sediminihabitans luteus]GIJ00616.1 oxidoreductase [Sediminihabitans luteus]